MPSPEPEPVKTEPIRNEPIETEQVEPEPAGPAQTKQALRRAITAGRRTRSASERAQAGPALAAIALRLAPLRRATSVALYASLPDEPDTGPLRRSLRELGIRVLLPVVPDDPGDRRLNWSPDLGRLSLSGRLALPEPPGERLPASTLGSAQVVIVPALAVDSTGTRLGRGRGYYDTALLHASPSALVVAMIQDDELLDAQVTPIPREPHDRSVHAVVTPTRAVFF